MSESSNLSNITNSIKSKLNIFTSNFFIEILAYLVGGFILGIALKYLRHYIFWFILFFIAVMIFMESNHAITINYNFFYDYFNISPDATIKDISGMLFNWFKDHIFQYLAGILGVYLAWEYS